MDISSPNLYHDDTNNEYTIHCYQKKVYINWAKPGANSFVITNYKNHMWKYIHANFTKITKKSISNLRIKDCIFGERCVVPTIAVSSTISTARIKPPDLLKI